MSNGFTNNAEVIEFLKQEYNHPFTGWDFSHIRDRMVSYPLSFSYTTEVLYRIHKVDSVLDMGTGGGEYFANNFQPFPRHTCATESYESNIPIARKRLEPLGVKVFPFTDDKDLPFQNEEFELITNQHESYAPEEVYRILKPGCEFLTKQVDGDNDMDLQELLGAPIKDSSWHLAQAIDELENVGFRIRKTAQDKKTTRIFDVGAIVYYCKIVPWAIPDFSIEKYKKELVSLHTKILEEGFIEVNNPRFFIIAKRDEH